MRAINTFNIVGIVNQKKIKIILQVKIFYTNKMFLTLLATGKDTYTRNKDYKREKVITHRE